MSSPPQEGAKSPQQFRPARRTEKTRKFLVGRPGVNRAASRATGVMPAILKYSEMIYVIVTTPVYATILSKVVDTAENDHLAKALVNVGISAETIMAMTWGLLESEFATSRVNSILRGNSLCTKMETIFCRLVGQEFLQSIFGKSLLLIVTDTSLDLDTSGSRSSEGQMRIDENRQRVVDIAQEFVDCFTSERALVEMPTPIRAIASFTGELAKKYAPERIYPLVGGFILLRFFNPAIIAPESLGLIPEDITMDKSTRSNLIVVTKLLQKLSNEVVMDDSDPQAWMNPFILKNRQKMREYYDKLIQDPKSEPGEVPFGYLRENKIAPSAVESIFRKIDIRHVNFLHRLLHEHAYHIFHRLIAVETVDRNGVETSLHLEFLKMMMSLEKPPGARCTAPERSGSVFWLPPRPPTSVVDTWIEASDEELTVRNTTEEFVGRFGQTAAQFDDFVLVFGGCTESGENVPIDQTMLRFDIEVGRWSSVMVEGREHPHRYYHSSAAHRGSFYIFGGMLDNSYLNDMYRFSIESWKWEQVKYSGSYVPEPRIGHVMCIHGNRLFLFGGYVFDGKKYSYDNNIIEFDLNTFQWTKESYPNCPSPRVHSSVVVHKNNMWLYGGRNEMNEPLQDLYRFCFETKSWKIAGCHGSIPPPRWGATTTVIERNGCERIMILYGGCDLTETFNDLHIFHFESQMWEKVDVHPMGLPVSMHSVSFFAGHLYVFFGGTYSTTGTLSDVYQDLAVELFQIPPSQFPSDIARLYANSKFSDLMVVQTDGTRIPAHKCVMYARCPFLLSEIGSRDEFKFTTYEPRLTSIFLRYLYTDDIPYDLTLPDLSQLIDIFLKYRIYRPVRIMEERLRGMITSQSVIMILTIGNESNLRGLKHACLDFIRNNPMALSHSPELNGCSKNLICQIATVLFPPREKVANSSRSSQ